MKHYHLTIVALGMSWTLDELSLSSELVALVHIGIRLLEFQKAITIGQGDNAMQRERGVLLAILARSVGKRVLRFESD
ncbi:hypothetical protein ABIE63_003350 [Limibacillus sp. MBR-115]|jgi:hypothetical protein